MMGKHCVVALTLVVGASGGGQEAPATKPAPYTREGAPKEHVEEIAAGEYMYQVAMDGTLDGFNTAQYLETYGGHMRQESKFEPNQYLVLENIGDVDVVNPRIVINGRRNWFSADDILASVLKPGMSNAEKAMAIFRFTSRIDVQSHDNSRRVGPPFPAEGTEHVNQEQSHPSRNTFQERANPVKAANCYYCSGCSLSAANFVVLCRHAGLVARAVWMCPLNTYQVHCVGEAWYDGDWHLFDPERRSFYLEPDNATVASYEDLHRNPALASRTHDGGFAAFEEVGTHAEDYRRFYPPHIMPVEQWLSTMDMTLRPGERFIWRWDHAGKYRYGANLRQKSDLAPYQLANGKLVYRPRLGGEAFQRGIVAEHNIRSVVDGESARLQPEVVEAPGLKGEALEAPAGHVTYKVESPYPIVGALVGGRFFRRTAEDTCRVRVSVHDSDWVEVWTAQDTGDVEAYVTIDHLIDPKATPAVYDYYVKFEIQAAAAPEDACLAVAYIETDVQIAATALPALSVGENAVVYRDASGPQRRVRITHGWRESIATQPPRPPLAPVTPLDNAEVDLASLTKLAWQPAGTPDGTPVAAYHIQVGPRADMLHPISPNFDRIVPAQKPEWDVPEGWVAGGRRYYWRVRAQNTWGAWSDWSQVWTFRIGE